MKTGEWACPVGTEGNRVCRLDGPARWRRYTFLHHVSGPTYVTNKTNFEWTNLLPQHFYDVKVAAVNQGGSTITGIAIYTKYNVTRGVDTRGALPRLRGRPVGNAERASGRIPGCVLELPRGKAH